MEVHHPGDHMSGLSCEFEWHWHRARAGGFVIPLHMVGAWFGDAQNIKLGISGIWRARMCSEGWGRALWLSYSWAPAVLCFSWLSDLGPLGGERASGWAEVGGQKVLFLLWSAGGSLQCCKNDPDYSAKNPKNPTPTPQKTKLTTEKLCAASSGKTP